MKAGIKTNRVDKIFHDCIDGLEKNVEITSQPITVDVELRFKGLEISESGFIKKLFGKRENKRNQLELNLATQIHIEPQKNNDN